MFQNLNGTVQNVTRTQDQIGRLANETSFGAKQLETQLASVRETKVKKDLCTLAKIFPRKWKNVIDSARELLLKGRLGTGDLLFKKSCFVNKRKFSFSLKSS